MIQELAAHTRYAASTARRWITTRRHPIDRQYRIETSLRVPPRHLAVGDPDVDRANVGYIGSQPSIVRRCFAMLPELSKAMLVDLGCGKGRVCVVATEFPFRAIIGLELAPQLAKIAQRNAAILRNRFPERTAIDVRVADATRPPLDGPAVVLFLYNSFRAGLVAQLIGHIEAALAGSPELKIFVVYYNPVHHGLFDDSDAFARFAAEKVLFDPAEALAARQNRDSFVIYQSRSAPFFGPLPGAERRVSILIPDLAADVVID